MKQGVKIYRHRNPKTGETIKELKDRTFYDVWELMQADIRKQNQLGWYVHQVITDDGSVTPDGAFMVVYRRDEEM